MIQIAVLGYGTVGSGVVEVFQTNKESIAQKAGEGIEVKYVLDLREFPGDPVEKVLVHDFETILQDPEVAIVVETMGGLHPAYEFSKQSLEAGKSVCTSNKELVARHGQELMTLARAKGVNYLFEASCGGGIPIIRPLHNALTADVIDEITGILNGTTNYILSKMTSDGSDFAQVLKEAQDKGYAERNPEADVEGYDACRKIAILSSIAYGKQVNFEDIYTEGITKITPMDIKYAQAIKARIKLLASSRKSPEGICAMVAPVLIPASHPLYSVQDVFNAIFVHGNMLGDAMFYGSGAGKLPTASAVSADVIDCARNPHTDVMAAWAEDKQELMPVGQVRGRFFVRVEGNPQERGEELEKTFGKIEPICLPHVTGEFAFLTEEMTEAAYQEKADQTAGIISRIRVRF